MRITLVGQPNCGKSTIFNHVAGYKAITSNFPGKTVKYSISKMTFQGMTSDIVDLPGSYSMTSFDLAELEARKYLLREKIDVVINVIDASLLGRGLELTLQLLELNLPTVICLNMIDEAEAKGIIIDTDKLSRLLGVPIVTTIAHKGWGLNKLFETAFKVGQKSAKSESLNFSKDVEQVIKDLSEDIKKTDYTEKFNVPHRFLATKLLENDQDFIDEIKKKDTEFIKTVQGYQHQLEQCRDRSSDEVVSSERHHLSMQLYESVVKLSKPKKEIRNYLDSVLMHPVFGYISLVVIMYLFFNFVFYVGAIFEEPLLDFFYQFLPYAEETLGADSLLYHIVSGVVQGLAGGIAIVLPFLFPFLLGLAFLEDTGYLPRVAYLMDTFLHRIGLHGKAIIPLILGYGCTVPAVMATRILESERDRFITSVLTTMIPCAARITIIFGLVAFYLGPKAAIFVFVFNIIVVAIAGKILSNIMPEITPGMILEIPAYHVPSIKILLSKVWLRMKEFIVIAWPLLIIGSVVLSLLKHWNLEGFINQLISPVTLLLGLPVAVGVTLIFGVLRKELSMVMLVQALGVANISTVMSSTQIMTFTIFVLFYVPCVATIAVLIKEIGSKRTLFAIIFTFLIAIILATITRFVY
ncbi:MAG: Ferrous iron transport protein B [candidate division TA06 bacterium 32_111]|jgi:ferrous iron transport protein B|nr:MAG: Ferrous iron transport protein B [candidate division TA06 bacterium 32_111]